MQSMPPTLPCRRPLQLVIAAAKNRTDTAQLAAEVVPHSDVVEEAPEAPLWAGYGDLSTMGACNSARIVVGSVG